MSRTMILALLVSGLALPAAARRSGGEIHGTIETVDGKRYTGPVRWGGDEAFWEDTLDAHKTEVIEDEQGEEKGFELSFFGWKVVDSGAHGPGPSAVSPCPSATWPASSPCPTDRPWSR